MAFQNVTNAAIRFSANVKEITKAEKSFDKLRNSLERTTKSSIAVSSANRSVNRSLDRMSASSAASATSLGALQTQMTAASAASTSFESNVGNISGALSNLDNNAKKVAIGTIFEDLDDQAVAAGGFLEAMESVGDVDIDADDDVRNFVNSLDDKQLWEFVAFASGEKDLAIDDSLDVSLDQIQTAEESLQNIFEGDIDAKDDMFQDIFSPAGVEDALEDLPDSPAEVLQMEDAEIEEIFADAGAGLKDIGQFRQSLVDQQEGLQMHPGILEDKFIDFDEHQDLWEMEAGTMAEYLDPDELIDDEDVGMDQKPSAFLPERLFRELGFQGGYDEDSNIADILALPDQELNRALGQMGFGHMDPGELRSEVLTAIPETDGIDEITSEVLDTGEIANIFETTPESSVQDILRGHNFPLEKLRETDFSEVLGDFEMGPAQVGEIGEFAHLEGDGIFGPELDLLEDAGITKLGHVLETSNDELNNILQDVSIDAETLQSELLGNFEVFQKKAMGENAEELIQSFESLAGLSAESDAFADVLYEAQGVEEAIEMMGETFEDPKQLREFQNWAHNNREALEQALDGMVGPDRIGVGTEGFDELHDTVHGALRGPDMGGEEDDGLPRVQTEMLSRMMSDLDSRFLQGREDWEDFPVTDLSLRAGLLQEILDSDDAVTQRTATNLLQNLHEGEIDLTERFLGSQEGGSIIQQDLTPLLSDELVDAGAPDEILGELQNLGEGPRAPPLTAMIGEDPDILPEEAVGRALSDINIDDPRAVQQAATATEQVLNEQVDRISAEIAPGLQAGASGTEDVGLVELFAGAPDEDYLDFVSDATDEVRNFQDEAFFKRKFNMRSFLDQAPILGRVFGDERERGRSRGLYGGILQQTSRQLARFQADTGRNVRRTRRALDNLSETYDGMLPLLEATSIRLGSINVNYESAGIMIFKLTSMLGPLAAGLFAVAAGAGAAAAGMASFIGVGALTYLEEMEDTMAGVNDKTEAMGELKDLMTDMGREAITPLEQARLGGDGRSGFQLFEDILRGGLRLLHRFAKGMAELAELPVVQEQVQRLSNIIHGGEQDDSFINNMAIVLENMLPLLVDFFEHLVKGFGGAAARASELADSLGGRLLDTLDNASRSLALMINYGAGFMAASMEMIKIITAGINAVTRFLDLFGKLPGITQDTASLAYRLGALVGVITILSKVLNFLAGTYQLLISIWNTAIFLKQWMIVLKQALIAHNKAWAASMLMAAKAAITLLGTLGSIVAILIALHDIGQLIWGDDEAVVFFDNLETAILATAAAVLTLAGALKYLQTVGLIGGGAAIGGGAIASGLGGLVSAAGALLAKLASVTALVGVIAAVLGGDILYYLITGESALGSWIPQLQSIYEWIGKIGLAIGLVVAGIAAVVALAAGASVGMAALVGLVAAGLAIAVYKVGEYIWGWVSGIGSVSAGLSRVQSQMSQLKDDAKSFADSLTDGARSLGSDIVSGTEDVIGSASEQSDVMNLAQESDQIDEDELSEQNPFDVRLIDLAGKADVLDKGSGYSDRGGGRRPGKGGDTHVTVEITNNGQIGTRDISRMIQKEFESMISDTMRFDI